MQRFRCCCMARRERARASICAILRSNSELEIIVKRASDILSKWIGESPRAIAQAFKEAAIRKAFLVFDEADSLLAQRDDETKPWQSQQVNEMLTWMESHNYPFACTTNLIENIDRAALRRFVFKI